ncbi:serine/threonine protein kinase, partial [Streptosporangium sp. NPDC049248]
TPELVALLTACLDKHPYERPDTKAAMLRLLGEEPAIRITGDVGWQEEGLPALPQQPGVTASQPVPPSGWGVPPLPRSAASAPQGPVVLQAAAETRKRQKTGGFSIMLAACVGVVALLSGLGLWAAGRYTSLDAQRASADGAVPQASLSPFDQSWAKEQNLWENPADTGKVAVPWGTTTDPQTPDVEPLRLSTEVPTISPPVPSTTSFVTSPQIPATTAPAVPTTTGAPSTPTPTAEPTPTPTPTAEPTPAPTATPTPSEPPTPTPTPSESATPSVTPSATPTPTATPTPPSKPTVKPTPAPSPPAASPSVEPSSQPSSPPPAASRPNPYTPQQVCGSGYYVQRSDSFSGGTTYQLYNASAGS